MLELEGLTKRYGSVTALRDVDLYIPPASIMSLLGPNGAGKTTLISIVVGLLRPDAGTVRVAGQDAIAAPLRAQRMCGFAPQEFGLYRSLTARENLVFFGEVSGLRGKLLANRIDEAVDALELAEYLPRLVRILSVGEKRRLQTATALLHRPQVLLLDEPTAGVDVSSRAQILNVVRRAAAEGTAVCYCTHYLQEVEALDAGVAILNQGEIIASGPVSQLVRDNGESALELRFDGDAPEVHLAHPVVLNGSTIRVLTPNPAGDAAAILQSLGAASKRLVSTEILRPSLESVFLTLTGRRYETEAPLESLPAIEGARPRDA